MWLCVSESNKIFFMFRKYKEQNKNRNFETRLITTFFEIFYQVIVQRNPLSWLASSTRCQFRSGRIDESDQQDFTGKVDSSYLFHAMQLTTQQEHFPCEFTWITHGEFQLINIY